MEHLTGIVMVRPELSTLATSALPDAPVVPHVEPSHRLRRARLAVSLVLHRTAEAVAPREYRPVC